MVRSGNMSDRYRLSRERVIGGHQISASTRPTSPVFCIFSILWRNIRYWLLANAATKVVAFTMVARICPHYCSLSLFRPFRLVRSKTVCSHWSRQGMGSVRGSSKPGAATDEIPASSVMPSHPTIGCAQEIRGMFLSPYYEIQVYGVTRGEAQEKIIRALNNHRISSNTFPVRVEFFDSDYWIYRTQGNLATRQKGPGKQLRLVFLDDWLTEAVLRPIARANRNSNSLRQ